MLKKSTGKDDEIFEMIDESDSTEDSDDEDYNLGDNLFTNQNKSKPNKSRKLSTKSNNSRNKTTNITPKTLNSALKNGNHSLKSDTPIKSASKEVLASRLFEIIIGRKHARLSSCLQRIYLSLSSEDKFVTIAEILSFIIECSGFTPNLVHYSYLDNSSPTKTTNETNELEWDVFKNLYNNLPNRVNFDQITQLTNEDSSNGVNPRGGNSSMELEDSEVYGSSINFENGHSLSHTFYSVCNRRMKFLNKKLDYKEGWMIDFGSVGFHRFCEFFNELILQVELPYFQHLLTLIEYVFVLSTCQYRGVRLLSTVACNELIKSLLLKLDVLKKDQVVLRKQLLVEADLDKRAATRLGGDSALSNSTVELYKRVNLVNITCSAIVNMVKTSFYVNYSAKSFDIVGDLRVVSAYYLVVHSIINPELYHHSLYMELVTSLLSNMDDNLPLLLKFILINGDVLEKKIMERVLRIYTGENNEVNQLIEFIHLKHSCSQTSDKLANTDDTDNTNNTDKLDPTDNGVKTDKLDSNIVVIDDETVYNKIVNSNNKYIGCVYLLKELPKFKVSLKLDLNLTNVKSKYQNLFSGNNKPYHHHVYNFNTGKGNSGGEDYMENMRVMCNSMLKHSEKESYNQFVNNLVSDLVELNFFDPEFSYFTLSNYVTFLNPPQLHTLYNTILLQLLKSLSSTGSSTDLGTGVTSSLDDFITNCDELYKLNKTTENNLLTLLNMFNEVVRMNVTKSNKFKVVDLVLKSLDYLLNSPNLLSISLNILSNLSETGEEAKDISSNTTLKNKINSFFNTNFNQLYEFVVDLKSDTNVDNTDDVMRVLYILNSLMSSFNFVKLDETKFTTLFNKSFDMMLSDSTTGRTDLVDELMVFYYLVYEYIILKTINTDYYFDFLPQLHNKLLLMLLNKPKFSNDTEKFITVSTALSILKLSNIDFLKNNYSFTMSSSTVNQLLNYVTDLFLSLYQSNKSILKLSQKKSKLNILNDGCVTISYKYTNSTTCLDTLNILYVAESVVYQYAKTLNKSVYDSNISIIILLNSCSGYERVRVASQKFLEILSKLDLTLFNLISLHCMTTLYELSQFSLLSSVITLFNQFENGGILQFIYHLLSYIKKSQSNHNLQQYIRPILLENPSVKTASDEKYNNILKLIKLLKDNQQLYLVKYMEKLFNVEVDDDFNDNLLTLRRNLNVKSVEQLCANILNSIPKQSKSTSKPTKSISEFFKPSSKVDKPDSKLDKTSLQLPELGTEVHKPTAQQTKPSSKHLKNKRKRMKEAGTTLLPHDFYQFNDNTTHSLDSNSVNKEESSPEIVRNYTKRTLLPSMGIKNKFEPIELRDDELNLEDLETFNELEPFEDVIEVPDDLSPTKLTLKSSSLHFP
ncbi:hypothetical protein TpMuguga_04g00214 [Theileria parva strain Muguga]|uniref:STAG domain-containing protein n=1 Tax=Theileria parva TaxID=5875 RepID=Q4N2X8_THEPA|nr:uncharacterized protein TpMuguga_04g00214 [Theileria parva strain Muguga]EAN31566.1 hypothetical protein TpMuguga_04g00214 [Theileria parva strain Muguga]|eukprot:XP_763849.1 hypothetical protein [Theileria parva strain Muguga]